MAFSQMHSSGRWLFLRCILLADGFSYWACIRRIKFEFNPFLRCHSSGRWLFLRCILLADGFFSDAFFWQMAFSQMHSSGRWLFLRCILLADGFVAGVRFLSFSGLKGPNSGPPRVVVSVDDSRGSLWFRRRFRRTSGRLCCGGPLFELFGAERSKFRTPAGRSICGWFQGFTLVPEKVPQNVWEALLRGSAFWAFRGWKVQIPSWRSDEEQTRRN